MAIIISGTGIDMGQNAISNASQVEVQEQQVSPFSGFKNFIINGNFDIAQRDTIFNFTDVTHAISLDMWGVCQLGAGHQQQITVPTATINGANLQALRSYQTTAGRSVIYQILEHVNSKYIRGKVVTVSFWYRAKGNLGCYLNERTDRQTYSTDFETNVPANIGTVIGSINNASTKPIISDETWRYASFQATTTANGYYHLSFNQDHLAGNYYEIAQVQLEIGSIATPFENRPYGLELALCQRYYERLGVLFNITTATAKFQTCKRVLPTITITSAYGQESATVSQVGLTTSEILLASTNGYVGASITASAEL